MIALRKAIPLGVKLKATLLAAGFTEAEIEGGDIQYDHQPAIGLRLVDPDTGRCIPDVNDYRYIKPRRKADHQQKTTGRKPGAERTATTAGSDIGNIAKSRRLVSREEEFRRRLLARNAGEPKPPSKWPKRAGKMQGRGFGQ